MDLQLILWAVTTPAYILLLTARVAPAVTLADGTFARAITALVVLTYFADEQMWAYQTAKQTYRRTARAAGSGFSVAQLERGFVTTGLWHWSRHPNFAAEQAVWCVFYAWPAWVSGCWWNWTVVGALQYLAVFQGSTPLTEAISRGKYEEYPVYQQRVGRFLPRLWGKRWEEEESVVQGEKKRK